MLEEEKGGLLVKANDTSIEQGKLTIGESGRIVGVFQPDDGESVKNCPKIQR